MTGSRAPLAAPLLLLALLPGAAAGQSLLSAGGLGVPIAPVDARALALGGVGAGLFGPSLLPTDPAAAADQGVPTVSFTLASSWVDVEEGDALSDASGTRFPFIGVAYPVKTWGTATLTYGSVLDQRWRSTREHDVPLEESTARVTDAFVSDGGLAALRVGFAHRVAPSLAVGASLGTYTGDLSRVFTRSFDSLDVETEIPDFRLGGQWVYSGLTGTVGAVLDVAEFVRVSASVDWSGDLEAEPTAETAGAPRAFDLPLALRVGASAALAPGLVVTAAASRADWTAAGESLSDAEGRSALTIGGGIEWMGASFVGRETPLRLGYRKSDLPFGFAGEAPTETVFSGGIGLNLLTVAGVPRAAFDLGVERGRREAGPLTESFWRSSLSLRVSGF